jgi:hypothetical protein
MRLARLPLLLVVLAALSGCVQTRSTMLASRTYPPLTPEEVTIYLTEDDIPGDFERIAILNSKGSTNMTNEQQLMRSVRQEAARIGANGVLYARPTEPSAGVQVAAAIFGVGTNRRSEMVAIFVHTEAPAAAPVMLVAPADSTGGN